MKSNLEKDPYINGQQIYDKDGAEVQWGMNSLFHNIKIKKVTGLDLYFIHKKIFKWI